MKKIVRLTEADLARIVRRVIKEQPNDYTDDESEDFEVRLKDTRDKSSGVLEFYKYGIVVVGTDEKTTRQFLKKFLRMHGNTVTHMAFLNCESIDFSSMNFCQYPELMFLNLKGTPNNFEETQEDCYTYMGGGKYDLGK